MRRISCKIETFTKLPKEDDPWSTPDWNPDPKQQYDSLIIDGGFDADDLQFYMGVRDDRVALGLKGGRVLSIVCSLEEFEHLLESVNI